MSNNITQTTTTTTGDAAIDTNGSDYADYNGPDGPDIEGYEDGYIEYPGPTPIEKTDDGLTLDELMARTIRKGSWALVKNVYGEMEWTHCMGDGSWVDLSQVTSVDITHTNRTNTVNPVTGERGVITYNVVLVVLGNRKMCYCVGSLAEKKTAIAFRDRFLEEAVLPAKQHDQQPMLSALGQICDVLSRLTVEVETAPGGSEAMKSMDRFYKGSIDEKVKEALDQAGGTTA